MDVDPSIIQEWADRIERESNPVMVAISMRDYVQRNVREC